MSNALWLDNLEVISMTTKGDTKTVKAAIRCVADACPSCGVVGRYHREIEDVLSIDVCGSCHYIFNKMYVPFADACEGPDERHLH